MNHASLFSGIGGFDLAAEWAGFKNVFQVEIDDWCQKLLIKNFPNVQRYKDIKEFDGRPYAGTIDILTGGFPCQPFSQAGKRRGTEDDRYLWPEMLRVIREVQPQWVVGENVAGIITWNKGMVFEQVCTDLEATGYEVQPLVIPACAVDASHRRDRVWFISHSNSFGIEGRLEEKILGESDISRRKTSKPLPDLEGQFNSFESRLCRSLHGIPNGVDRIKGLGNAIVPQVVYQIFTTIKNYETLKP